MCEAVSVDPRDLDDDALEARVLERQLAIDRAVADQTRDLSEVERRRSYARDGHTSVTAWLMDRGRMSGAAAKRRMELARSLQRMPIAREALADGEISVDQAEVLSSAREADPETFTASEGSLTETARRASVKELRAVALQWRIEADAMSGVDRLERQRERRRLSAAPTVEGTVRVEGVLDPVAGQTLITAIRSIVDAEIRLGEEDLRTPAQQRADALVKMARYYLDSPGRPHVGGERPHVVVRCDLEALQARGGSAQLEDVGPVDPQVARELAAEGSITRVVMRGRSEILDVGRKTRAFPKAVRTALLIRDGTCVWPTDCDRPIQWCDTHHVQEWEHGGETSLTNAAPLCRVHHGLLRKGYRMEGTDGHFTFYRPDGSVIEDRAPP